MTDRLVAADVLGFAGSMAAGVDQAGFVIVSKREPAEFGGFGIESMTYNMPWVEAQVADPDDWEMPVEPVDLVYGCPPCSGFSQLSAVNTKVYEHTGTTYRGADAEINKCMVWFVDYVARVKPQAAIMESVGPAFKLGREWMESLYARLLEKTGEHYFLSHVNMDAQWVGGDVKRPRYFWVVTKQPFGIGVEFTEPRDMLDVIQDLGPEDLTDPDWAHFKRDNKGSQRITDTILWLEAQGREWKPGTRLPQNTEGLEAPDFWYKPKPTVSKREGFDGRIYSHWFSTDPFSPVRWRPDKPFGVIVAASLDRAIHPTEPRPITYREAARFMSIPDTWSMRVIHEKNKPEEVGKAVPSASAKWIAHWVKMSIEGTPGEYAGRDEPVSTESWANDIRVFHVQKPKDILRAQRGDDPDDLWWSGEIATDSPDLWLIDRKQRPGTWFQRQDPLGIFIPKVGASRKPRQKSAQPAKNAPRPATRETIRRIEPERVAALLERLGIDKAEAATRLGVSVSRINELTTHTRPRSWLNAERWDEVQAALQGTS